ncbi:MAG: hypothetical protein V2A54_15645 [Bacteroidota bacterium]
MKLLNKIRYLKLLTGTAVLGLFMSGCGDGKNEKKSTRYDTIPATDSSAHVKEREDSIKIADSLKSAKLKEKADSTHKSDSIKKAKKKKVQTTKPPPVKTCYMPKRIDD